MNKEKQFKSYRPLLEYLFGPMSDQDYGALFWPGSSNAKHNMSRFLSHGEKTKEVKRRITALLALEPGLLAQRGQTRESDAWHLNMDMVAGQTFNQVCTLLEPSWRMKKILDALAASFELIIKLAKYKNSNVALGWMSVRMLLQRTKGISAEHLVYFRRHLRLLEKDMNRALQACEYIAYHDPTRKHIRDAEILFRCSALAPNAKCVQKNPPSSYGQSRLEIIK